LKIQDFYDVGAGGLLVHKYKNSPSFLLSKMYPDYEWLPWKFTKSPRNFKGDETNKRKFLEWAGKQLGVKELNDWYNVSARVFSNYFPV
jgi:hypothetical protein